MEGDDSIDMLETDGVSLNAYGSVVEADQNVERSVHSEVGDKIVGRRTGARFQQKEKKLARRFSSLWQIAFSSESSLFVMLRLIIFFGKGIPHYRFRVLNSWLTKDVS